MFKKGLDNTNWPDSQKLMKVLVTIYLNRLSSLHIPLWHITLFTVSYLLSEIFRILDNSRNRNLEICYSFFQESHRDFKIYEENFERILLRFSHHFPTMVRQWRKFFFSRTSKMSEYVFNINIGRKINIERRNTSSQWLALFMKFWPCKLSLQRGGNFNNL